MKKSVKKLQLAKETVRSLEDIDNRRVLGGTSECGTLYPSGCYSWEYVPGNSNCAC